MSELDTSYLLDQQQTVDLILYNKKLCIPLKLTMQLLLDLQGETLESVSKQCDIDIESMHKLLAGSHHVSDEIRNTFRNIIYVDPWEIALVNTHSNIPSMPDVFLGTNAMENKVKQILKQVNDSDLDKCVKEFSSTLRTNRFEKEPYIPSLILLNKIVL